ncbi:MAG: PhzF family phenazine biosynthesis protein [Acidobacteriota bacterium]
MKSAPYVIADVFTDRQFGGNQLAVFYGAEGIDSATMQNIAREMNYSETTFLLAPERGGDFRLRIFTPQRELPFAGHPIVGTAHVIAARKMKEWSEPVTTVMLETGVGDILVRVQINDGQAGHTEMTQPLPELKARFEDTARFARALSIDPADIAKTRLPIEALHNGITTVVVPVASMETVRKIKVDTGALESICKELRAETVTVFTQETIHSESAAHCRVFAPEAGVAEDAATGSANGPLGFYLVRHRVVAVQPTTRIISEQGYEMNRPSTLHIEIDSDRETITGVRVGGGVVLSGQGEIFLL